MQGKLTFDSIETYKTLFDLSTDSICVLDSNDNVIECSKNFASMLGYSYEECLKLRLEDWDTQKLTLQAKMQNAEFQTLYKCKDNSYITVSLNIKELPLEGKHFLYLWAKDITQESKLLNEQANQLREELDILPGETITDSLHRWKLALDGSGVGLWDWNLKSNTVYYSTKFKEMIGYDPDEFSDSPEEFFDHLHPQDKERVQASIEHHFRDPQNNPYELKIRLRCKDGSYKWILTAGKVLLNADATPKRMIGYHTDIDEIIATESALEESQKEIREQKEEFETIFKTSKDGIAILDLTSKFTKVNHAYANITGYTEEELLKRTCISMSVPEDISRAQKALAEAMEVGFIKNFEKSCFKKDGSIFTINMSAAMMPDKEHFLITTKDITNDVQLRNELLKAKEEADRANRSKSEFLANMSHEIRTPMTGILGFVENLSKDEKDPQRRNKFNIIKNSGTTLLSIINDILDFSKIESGKMELEAHPHNLKELFTEIIGIFDQESKRKKIKLIGNVDTTIPSSLLMDQVRLKQVIFNLLSNAVKFTSENGTITIDARFNHKDSTLSCSVTDTGVGIPKNKQEKIFEAFRQEDTSTTRRYGGTGLGLSISYKLIHLMGGKLHVDSTLGKGSCFCFEIPLAIATSTQAKEKPDNSTQEISELKGHVLVVEDNKTNQLLLGMILDDLNLTYDLASDGVKAIEQFKQKRYGIILMDENMPNMNGIEAAKHIRDLEIEKGLSTTPIVAVTANALSNDRERFLNSGMDDYISKPYSENDIIKVLSKYLN